MLHKQHGQEWQASMASPGIIGLNVVSLKDFEPYDRILYNINGSDRRNDGRIRDKLLKRYRHLEEGGWWVSGKDLLTGEDSAWGQFKPDIPYHYQENQGKTKLIKYETPKNVPTEIIALKVSFLDSWNIVKHYTESAKIAWIKRIEDDWKIISEAENVQAESTRSAIYLSGNKVVRSETADPQKLKLFQFFKELQRACAVREYRKIDRLLQTVQNFAIDSREQSERSHKRGIEKLSLLEDREFWTWLVNSPEIPVTLTEGAKKAGAITFAGYVVVALPGIYNGYRQPKDKWGNKVGTPHLIPQLKLLAQGGRKINFCFDNDPKPSTAKNVRTAIIKTGTLLQLQGASVSVISWQDQDKGVDDLIAERGVDYFRAIYKARTSLSNFKLKSSLDISKYQPQIINQRYLSDNLVPPELAQLIGLKSPKNTGKTEFLSRTVRRLINKGKPVLIITHRIQLAKALCTRFGVDHIEEVRNSETRGVFGYGLCIDSLHPNSQACFNPDDWSEAVVIIDEAEQVIWHLLDSSTCQENRVAIIETFQTLLKTVVSTGGQVYLSDADLSCIALDYISSLITSPIKTWVADNIYQPQAKRKLISYTGGDPRDLIAALVGEIEVGAKALIHTTGQKIKSKWGSINLESYLKEKFPLKQILRIDRDSVSEPGHPAYGCMGNLDQIISSYDIVIASPVIETGVSIDIKNHFDSVWAIAQGIQTVDAVCQTVERLREKAPRHIWIKTTAKGNRIGNGSTSVKALLKSQHKLTQANIRLLQEAHIDEFDELESDFSPTSFIGWARRACIVNSGKNEYRDSILTKLVSEGYALQDYDRLKTIDSNTIRQEIYQVCEHNYLNYCCQVSAAPEISDKELQELNSKKAKTEAERLSERKGNISKKYGVQVTPELVKKDDDGWYPQLQLLYYLSVGNKFLSERDRRTVAKFSENNQAFKPDLNKKTLSAKVRALQLIQISQFLDPEAEFSKDILADWFNFAIELRFDIQILLGVSINPEKDSAIAVAQRILKKLGLKLKFKCWRGSRNSKQRIYQGCAVNGIYSKIFAYWLTQQS